MSTLDKLQNELVVTLCLLEKHFPPSFFDIMIHLTVHPIREVRLCGLVYFIWIYPFERLMKVLKGYVRNYNHHEGCIVECYIAEEAIEFCTEFLSNVDAIRVPSSTNVGHKVGCLFLEFISPKLILICCCKHIIMCWKIQLSSNLISSKGQLF